MNNSLIDAPTADLIPILARIAGAETDVNRAIVRAIKRTMNRTDLPRRERVQLVEKIAAIGRTEQAPASCSNPGARRSTVEQDPGQLLQPGNARTNPGQANPWQSFDARTVAPTGANHKTDL